MQCSHAYKLTHSSIHYQHNKQQRAKKKKQQPENTDVWFLSLLLHFISQFFPLARRSTHFVSNVASHILLAIFTDPKRASSRECRVQHKPISTALTLSVFTAVIKSRAKARASSFVAVVRVRMTALCARSAAAPTSFDPWWEKLYFRGSSLLASVFEPLLMQRR